MGSKADPENLSVENLAKAIAKHTFKVRRCIDFDFGDDIRRSVQFIEKTEDGKKDDFVRGLVVGIDWVNREVCFVSDPHLEEPEYLDAYIDSAEKDISVLDGYMKHFP